MEHNMSTKKLMTTLSVPAGSRVTVEPPAVDYDPFHAGASDEDALYLKYLELRKSDGKPIHDKDAWLAARRPAPAYCRWRAARAPGEDNTYGTWWQLGRPEA
jgi:hypothetical protein